MKKSIILLSILIANLLGIQSRLNAQTIFGGPTCVSFNTGTSLYALGGNNWNSSMSVQWCVSGGTIVANGSSCYSGVIGTIGPFINVQWSTSGGNGSVTATLSGNSSTTLNVTIQSVSHATADIISQDQTVDHLTTPATITSQTNLPDGGGSCSFTGTLNYLWESSLTDYGPFNPTGVTSPTYGFSGPLQQTIYLRRRVTSYYNEVFYSNIIRINVVSVNWENLNYVRIHEIQKAGLNDWGSVDMLQIGDKLQSTTYLDGLGRTIQQVERGISPATNNTWKDIVTPFEYDKAGRVTKNYLPYATSDNPGKFKTNTVTAQPTYIQSFYGEPSTANTFTSIEYDDSPLSQVLKTMAAGQGWMDHTAKVSTIREFNKANEKVHIWTFGIPSVLPSTSPTSVYPTGTLARLTSTDEKSNTVITYIDVAGNVILKKVQEDASPGLEHAGWVCTYYVYDDFGHLRFTITPKAVKYLDENGWNFTSTLADKLCEKYIYDNKGRPSIKKQPETDEVWMVYDDRDRLVFTQDGNQRPIRQWTTTLYDVLDRPVITGITTLPSTLTQVNMQAAVIVQTATPTNPNTNLAIDRVVSGTDITGNFSALRSVTIIDEFTSGTSSDFIAEILPGPNGPDGETTIIEDVAVNKNPIPSSRESFLPLTITYYDNYNYTGAKLINNTYTLGYSTTPNIDPIVKTNRTTGSVTGEKVRVLDGDNNDANDKFLISSAYYDEKGRNIETLTDNIKNGVDYKVNQFDFVGRVMSTYTSHTPGNGTTYTIISKCEFDKIGRLVKLSKNYNNSFYKQLAEYSYDELGQPKTKRLAPGYTGNGGTEIETLTYDYNIQGWLMGINKDYALGDNDFTQWDRFFGLYLGYDNRDNKFASYQLNGNITGAIWRSQGDNTPRKFDYTYDRLDRFTSAIFKQRKTPAITSWSNSEVDLSTTIEYEDGNGNLRSMKHMGIIPGINNGVIVDDLRYSYISTGINLLNGNQLKQVDDLGTLASNNGLLGDFKESNTSQDYTYDVNGNLLKDLNKNIGTGSTNGITYNFLNKPAKVVIQNKSTIEFVYDATGAKLQKKVTYADNSIRITTYIGGFVYENFIPSGGGGQGESLLYLMHEEGRVKIITPHTKVNDNDFELNTGSFGLTSWPGSKQGVFEYYIKDNLGNTRMVLTEEVQKEYYKATMEDGAAAQEAPLFGQVNNDGTPSSANELNKTRLENSPPLTSVWTGNNTDIARLTASASDKVLGPNMVLKVMAGDIITSSANYYYTSNSTSGTNNLINSLGNSLVNALTGIRSSDLSKNQGPAISSNFTGNAELGTLLQQRSATGNTPKAYLNIVFLDEQFKYIDKNTVNTAIGTNYYRVSSANDPNAAPLLLTQKAPKNGWVYVFLSNESDQVVYFDNLQIVQEHSRISEENHYYPFGLKIGGISSHATNKLDSKHDYQADHAEVEEETGWDEFDLRMYDPQIGRWNGTDPFSQYCSPYLGMGNNPINSTDPTGGFDWFLNEETQELEFLKGKTQWDYVEGYTWQFQEGSVFNKALGVEGWGDIFGNWGAKPLGNVEVGNGFYYTMRKKAMIGGYFVEGPDLPDREWPSYSAAKPRADIGKILDIIKSRASGLPFIGPAVDVSVEAYKGPINDAYITFKAMGSGLGGYSKADITDLFGNPVSYDKRVGAGLNTLSLPLLFANPEAKLAQEPLLLGTQEPLLLGAPEAKLLQKDLEHIVEGHWATSGSKGKSLFSEGTSARDLKEMIKTASTGGTFRPNTFGRAGTIAEYDFGRTIGTKGLNPTSRLRVVIRPNGTVVTSFPY